MGNYRVVFENGRLRDKKIRETKGTPIIMEMCDKELWFKNNKVCANYFMLTTTTINNYIKSGKTTKDGYKFRYATEQEENTFNYDKLFGAYVKFKRNKSNDRVIK